MYRYAVGNKKNTNNLVFVDLDFIYCFMLSGLTTVYYTPMSFILWQLARNVLKHLSACLNNVRICKVDLLNLSTPPSDKYDYSKTSITYQIRSCIFLVRMIILWDTSSSDEKDFSLSTSLQLVQDCTDWRAADERAPHNSWNVDCRT